MISSTDLPGVVWRKSGHSSGANNCVEVAILPMARAVRDSKNTNGPALLLGAAKWSAFLDSVKHA